MGADAQLGLSPRDEAGRRESEPPSPAVALAAPDAVGVAAEEEELLLPVGGSQLWAVLHHPAGRPRAGVLIAAPFAAEKVKAHRTLVTLARELSDAGLLVARFDHRGEGDAGGEFADYSFEDKLIDLAAMVELLQQRLGAGARWGGVGLRLGANLLLAATARLAREGRGAATPLSLWAPVRRPLEHLQELLRSNVVEQGMRYGRVVRDREVLLAALAAGEEVVVEGFPFTGALFRQAPALTPQLLLPQLAGPVQWLELEKARGAEGAATAAGRAARELQQLELADLATLPVTSRFWLDFRYHRPHEPELFGRTRRFLEGHLLGDH